jgi:hypothetical protein
LPCGQHSRPSILGALALGAGLFWGLYMLTGKRAGALLGAQAPALGMWVGTLLVLPFGLEGAIEASFTVPVILPSSGWGCSRAPSPTLSRCLPCAAFPSRATAFSPAVNRPWEP